MDSETRVLSLRAGLAAHAAVKHDDVRLDFAELLVAEADSFRGARGEVLDDNVGPLDHLMRDGEAFGLGEVDGDAELALIHVGGGVARRRSGITDPRRNKPERVYAAFGFDA